MILSAYVAFSFIFFFSSQSPSKTLNHLNALHLTCFILLYPSWDRGEVGKNGTCSFWHSTLQIYGVLLVLCFVFLLLSQWSLTAHFPFRPFLSTEPTFSWDYCNTKSCSSVVRDSSEFIVLYVILGTCITLLWIPFVILMRSPAVSEGSSVVFHNQLSSLPS